MIGNMPLYNLPPELRYTPIDPGGGEVLLYRGFPAHQLDPSVGLLSSALAADQPEIVEDAMNAAKEGDIGRLLSHVIVGQEHQRTALTPFIYATPIKRVAACQYAKREGDKVATIIVDQDRVIAHPKAGANVALILGSVSFSEIVRIEDGPSLARSL